ncbi:MAG: DUF4336 domain-containing protein, partial [Deltaproteobacteria bacterium]|nr:DUF4336 domain-containing protein [Deltaproteobacteria bacterium]
MLGIPFPTRMCIVRLASGGLWLHSPVAATPARLDAASSFGPVHHIVAPNKFHHLFVKAWREAFPQATSWAEPALARRKPELGFERTLGDAAEPEWNDDLDQVIFGGSNVLPESVFFHRASRSAIFTDLIQNHDPAGETRFFRWLKGVNRCLAPDGESPRDWRLTVRNRSAARAALERVLAWDIERVVVSHGICVERDGHAFVERAFAWLN